MLLDAIETRALAPLPTAPDSMDPSRSWSCTTIGRAAVLALYDELILAPKPGLVSLIDSGSHDDMDASTFYRSLFALRHYFTDMAALGQQRVPFSQLQTRGIAAEARMQAATGGINTHRGAIFMLGLLCAAAGACLPFRTLTPATIRDQLQTLWGRLYRPAASKRRPHCRADGRYAAMACKARTRKPPKAFPPCLKRPGPPGKPLSTFCLRTAHQ